MRNLAVTELTCQGFFQDCHSSLRHKKAIAVFAAMARDGTMRRRVGPGNFTPSPSQNSGLEPLDSSGSCHPMRAAALRQNRRAPPVASWPIMVPTWIACPLRSTDITPLQHYYRAVRPSASHPYSRPRGSIHLWLLRLHRCQGSHVPTPLPGSAHLYSGCHSVRKQVPPEFLPRSFDYRGFDIV